MYDIWTACHIISFLHSVHAVTPGGFASPALSPTGPAPQAVQAAATTPRDALEKSGAKTNPEKIVAFAAYVGQRGDKDTFTVDDIKPLFRQARDSAPSNMARDMATAIRQNWIVESGIRGEYYLTDRVVSVLETGFDNLRQSRGSNGGARPRASAARRKKVPTPEVFANLEIFPTIDGYPNYHKLKTQTDKYLWAVYAAKLLGAEAVTNAELVWLTDRLGEGISTGNMDGCFRQNQMQGRVNKNVEDKVRITHQGIEYLKGLNTAGVKE